MDQINTSLAGVGFDKEEPDKSLRSEKTTDDQEFTEETGNTLEGDNT